MRSKRLPGLAVVTIDSGEQIGRVQRLVIDPGKKCVAALLVSARGSFRKQILPIDAVFAMGSHAITVRSKEALAPLNGDVGAALLARKERIELLGSPVITTRGELLGAVRDYEVTDRGEITALYVSGGFLRSLARREAAIPGELLISLGRDAAVVDERAALFRQAVDGKPEPSGSAQGEREQRPLRERLAQLLSRENAREAPEEHPPQDAPGEGDTSRD